MQQSLALREYVDFMQWFERNHPQLNELYWQFISIPTGNSRVGITGSNLDPMVFSALVKVQLDYYEHLENQGR